jgi:hypothetical protein
MIQNYSLKAALENRCDEVARLWDKVTLSWEINIWAP